MATNPPSAVAAAGAPPPSLGEVVALLLPVRRTALAGLLALLVGQAALPLLGLLAMRWLVDAAASGIRDGGDAAWSRVLLATALAAGVALLGVLVRAITGYQNERLGRRCIDATVDRLQAHALSLDLLTLEQPRYHELLHRAGPEAAQRPMRLLQDLGGVVAAATSLLTMAAALTTAHPLLPVAIVALAWPAAVVRLRHARAQLDLLAAHNEAQRDVQYLSGVLTGRGAAKDLRLADAGEQLRSEVSERRAALQTAGLRLSRRRAVADGLAQALQAGAMFAAYAFLGYGALHGGLSLGGLVLHAQAVQRAQSAVRDLLLAAAALREDQLFAAPLRDFLALRSRLPAAAEPTPLPAAPAALALARVHFTYPGQSQPLLRGLDLELRPGEHVALVGRNGAGKSTVVKLLCRLYDPGQGRVQYGGIDLRQLDAAALHRRLSVLFQDAAGFERSVVDNVAFGPGSARDAAAIDVTLAQVGLDAMVSRLPAGPATRLSRRFDGGHEPSAGEWRRLLLARALHRRAEILILDEPSAFLDPPALAALLQHLRTELRGTAVLLADHRLDCVQFADRVCVLEGGVIVEDGAPATLLARRGALAALFGNPVG